MYVLNGIRLSPNKPFTHNGIQYPANWISLSTESEKEALGIVYVAPTQTISYNSNFYNLIANNQVIEKDLEDRTTPNYTPGLKTIWKKQQDKEAYDLLSPTDWYVTRKSETGVDIPVDITSYRTSVRNVCEQRKDSLDAATTLAEFIVATEFSGMDWPESL